MRIILTFILFFLLAFPSLLEAQRVRKNYNEMTPSEKMAFLNALRAIKSQVEAMANHHAVHFNSSDPASMVHGNQRFLPWHRVFQYEFEEAIRAAGTSNSASLTVPYWDWRVEFNKASITWDESDMLGPLNAEWNLGRTMNGDLDIDGTPITNATNIQNLFNNSTGGNFNNFYNTFSSVLESYHGAPHCWVGSALCAVNSPRDPVFFLHHGFIDKVWAEWEDNRPDANVARSVFTETTLPHFNVNPSNIIDTRYLDLGESTLVEQWYAYNQKLLLDGLGGDFVVSSGGKVYCYLAWDASTSSAKGTVYAGDVKRDASDNVVQDNKGGFVVPSGVSCEIYAGEKIVLAKGFKANAGSNFIARRINTPCGFASNARMAVADVSNSTEEMASENSVSSLNVLCYPNQVKNNSIVEYTLPEDTNVKLYVINGMGQVVKTIIDNEVVRAGKHNKDLSMETLPLGAYHIILQTSGRRKSFLLIHVD